MKHRLLLLALLCLSFIQAQAQFPLNYIRYYLKIRVQDNSTVLDQRSNNNTWCNNSTTGNNQQWAVMPMYVKSDNGVLVTSNEYIIGSKSDGDVLDIPSSGNDGIVYCNSNFHGGNNQIFKLNTTTTANVYYIGSLLNQNKTLDKSNNSGGNVYFRAYHGGNNQKFGLSTYSSFLHWYPTLRNIVRDQPPAPPSPQSLEQSMPSEIDKFFKSETLIPYPLVKNDVATAYQVANTPFYRLIKYQYYKLPDDIDADIIAIPGETYQQTITTKVGMKGTSVAEVASKLNVSFSASGEVINKSGDISKTSSSQISTALEMSQKTVTSFEETTETTVSIVYTFNPPVTRRVVTYQLLDYYELYRQNGELVTKWEVNTNQAYRVFFPAPEPGGGRVRSGEPFTIVNGSVTTLSSLVSGSVKTEGTTLSNTGNDDLKLSISPNPGAKTIKWTYGLASDKEPIEVYILSQEGKIHKKEKLAYSASGNTIDISSLPNGLYLLKVVAGKNSITRRLLKE